VVRRDAKRGGKETKDQGKTRGDQPPRKERPGKEVLQRTKRRGGTTGNRLKGDSPSQSSEKKKKREKRVRQGRGKAEGGEVKLLFKQDAKIERIATINEEGREGGGGGWSGWGGEKRSWEPLGSRQGRKGRAELYCGERKKFGSIIKKKRHGGE